MAYRGAWTTLRRDGRRSRTSSSTRLAEAAYGGNVNAEAAWLADDIRSARVKRLWEPEASHLESHHSPNEERR